MKQVHFKLLSVALLLASCSPFSKLSKHNKLGNDDGYVLYTNDKLNLRSATFGDFVFSSNINEFRHNNNRKPVFKKVLLYAKTTNPAYDYYLLLNAKVDSNPNYIYKTVTVDSNSIILAISKGAPKEDIEFIAGKIATLKKRDRFVFPGEATVRIGQCKAGLWLTQDAKQNKLEYLLSSNQFFQLGQKQIHIYRLCQECYGA